MSNPSAPALNANLDIYLATVTQDPAVIESLRRAVVIEVQEPAWRLENLEAQLVKLDDAEARVRRLYIDGRMDDRTHDAEQDRIRGERMKVRAELATVQARADRPSLADVEALAASWAWNPAWDADAKRQWLERYVESIGVDRTGFRWCSMRIPIASGGMPTFHYGHSWDFEVPVLKRQR